MTIFNGEYNIINVQTSYYAVQSPTNIKKYLTCGLPGDVGAEWIVSASEGTNQYTIQNKTSLAYLGCKVGANDGTQIFLKLTPQIWTIAGSENEGQYVCSPTDSPKVVWCADDFSLDKSITLKNHPFDDTCHWTFTPAYSPVYMPISSGTYNIINVKSNLCAMLSTSEDTVTLGRQGEGAKWAVKHIIKDSYVIQNAAHNCYASLERDDLVIGSRYRWIWTIRKDTTRQGAYIIWSKSHDRCWGMDEEDPNFSVTVSEAPVDAWKQWIFRSVEVKQSSNMASLRYSAVLDGHTGPVTKVVFSPDGTRLASASKDHTARIWDVASGVQIGRPLARHINRVFYVAFSPDGTRIATASCDRTAHIYDASTGDQISSYRHPDEVTSVSFSPDGMRLATGCWNHTIHLWDVRKSTQIAKPFSGHTAGVRCVTFSPDGTRLASSSDDETARLWDARTGTQIEKSILHTGAVRSVAFSSDGTRLATGAWNGTVCLWDARTTLPIGNPLHGHTHNINCVVFSPDDTRIASAGGDHVRLWDVGTGLQIGEPLQGHTKGVWSVAFSPDGTRLASSADDNTVRLWII